jgi:hypothetical protein
LGCNAGNTRGKYIALDRAGVASNSLHETLDGGMEFALPPSCLFFYFFEGDLAQDEMMRKDADARANIVRPKIAPTGQCGKPW